MDFQSLSAARYSLRKFSSQPVEPEKLQAAFPEMAGVELVAMLPLGYPAEGAHPSRLHTSREPLETFVKYL